MKVFVNAADFAIFLFTLCLFGRIVLGFVMAYARDWRPTGVMLVLTEAVFTVTDPPLKFVRRFVSPLTLGQMRIDLSMLIVFVALFMLRVVLAYIPT
ncbi:YggT family protein [Demequina aurantiaca]|uniref:YggT family protein n=1 Tax=Demequina aurantiaca TaxID=676200 RepID=UPI000A05B572|nr:YggT family protein [Demequina aurantiaca]